MSDEKWKGNDGGSGDHHHHHPHHNPFHHHHEQHQSAPQYGTFQSVSSQPPAMGFPQPVPPPGASGYPSHPDQTHYPHGYQSVPAYAAVAEGRPLREPRLPCCGIGLGWFLFIIGFFLAAIPWYVAAFIMLCATRVDHREKPGYVACTIAAVIATIAFIFGGTKGAHVW
ncbi:60S ribosomal protein L18a-like protein [Phalaenopsis equestris]|uniref:60S ribosomal protein L18a-like protein n=1 Tax=Phalaenopsis equestris TaxID=78828 RepID=UPI0009E2479E|nr:60S ribosomal protein L18a-like protein [Phalaenopsis equestris]